MPRERVRMTRGEVEAFLLGKRIGVVGMLGEDGAPDGVPAPFSCAGGSVVFEASAGGPAHRNLLRDPRVVFTVEEFPSYAAIKGVSVHGRAALVGQTGERVAFRVEAQRVESFDFGKMGRRQAGEKR